MDWRKFSDISLKWKLIIPFILLAVTGAASLFFVSYKFQDSLIHVNEAKRLKNQYQFFLNDIELKRNMAMSLASLTAQNFEVGEALFHRDRERLIELLHPAYETLHKDFDVQQFHFHTEHATSFLRLHALDCCGEQMESFRHMITEAFETCQGCSGIELGTFGFGIRSVVPVFYLEMLVGTVEIGFSVGKPFLEEFKDHFGVEVLLYVKERPHDTLKILASTVEHGVLTTELVNRTMISGEQLIRAGKMNGRNVAAISGPIHDFSSNIEAVVEIIIDLEPTRALLSHYAGIAASIAILGLVISISFVLFISSVFTRRIGEVVKAAKDIAAGKRETKIEVGGRDEMGGMAVAINQMFTSLEVSRNKLQEYARDLEIMVEERTRSLRESEKTYRTLVENVPITVYMVMADGTMVFLNRAVEAMLDATPKELSGDHSLFDGYIDSRDRNRVIAHRKQCIREEEGFHLEYRMVHKNGRIVYCVDHAVAVCDEENGFIRMDGIIVDVTVQKQLHEEQLQAEELETLSQVSSRLAHEFRNPLTTIGGLTRRLLKSFERGDLRTQKAALIIAQVEKLEKIMQMMLSYLEPQTIHLKASSLNTVVTDAADKINETYVDKGYSVRLELDRSLHDLQLDTDKFKKCLVQLMENAVHRMQRPDELLVETKKIGEHAIVSIVYKLPLISEDDINDFFYPFTVAYPFPCGDLDNDIIMDIPVCKRIIHSHCGMINVSREEDEKLWIDISLPLEKAVW